MTRHRRRPESSLVPIVERLRWMRTFRLGAIVLTWAGWYLAPAYRGTGPGLLGAVTIVYLALSVTPAAVWRHERDLAVRIFGFGLLTDGVFLAIAAYSPDAAISPVRYLVLLHLIAVTLLASFRTGLKLAIWHTMLFAAEFQARDIGLLPRLTADPAPAVTFVALIWLVSLATATFAAVNERELRRLGTEQARLADLGARLQTDIEATAIGTAVVAELKTTVQVERSLLLRAGEHDWAVLAADGELHRTEGLSPTGDEVIRRAINDLTNALVDVSDSERDPWLRTAWPDARHVGLVPLHTDGTPIGLLIFENPMRRGPRIPLRTMTMVEQIASQASLALANARLVERLHRAATRDGLTGAANRGAFDERLAAEIDRTASRGTPLSLVMVDVDHFKSVNDNHGHAVGDDVLRHVVTILHRTGRHTDLVARYGGEEFAVIMPDTGPAAAGEVAERYRVALIETPGSPVAVTASFGIASLPDDGRTAAELSKAADDALYQAKRQGRNRVVTSRPPDAVAASPTGTGRSAR